MASRQQRLVVEKPFWVLASVKICRICDIEPLTFDPTHKVTFPVEVLAGTVVAVWAIEGNHRGALRFCNRVLPEAVARIETLASAVVVGVVVVRLVGRDSLLVKQF